jgi:hypothetical protein
MQNRSGWMLGAALATVLGCGDSGTGPGGDNEGARLASQFERLADSVDGAGYSPTADALRHAAEITRLTGHATPVTLTIDGASRRFLAVAEQLDFPDIQCSWPSDSGVAPPGDTVSVTPGDSVSVTPGDSGTGTADPPPIMDSLPNPEPPTPPECTRVGTFSMRTLIAWEPERMSEVVRIVADQGDNAVEPGVPDVMTGLPTSAGGGEPATLPPAPTPDDSGGGGGGGWGGYPGFMGEYLVKDEGMWFAVEGRQTNTLEGSGGACSAERARFDWAEFSCEAARFRFEFAMRVEAVLVVPVPEPLMDPALPPDQPAGDHAIAMAASDVDGVRLSVVAWTPPPLPPPGSSPPDPGPLPPDPVPSPPDSATTGR